MMEQVKYLVLIHNQGIKHIAGVFDTKKKAENWANENFKYLKEHLDSYEGYEIRMIEYNAVDAKNFIRFYLKED